MPSVIIVTVGTSIYHSATWDENNDNFRQAIGARSARKYQERWCNRQSAGNIRGGLLSPSNRLRNAPDLEENFHIWLKDAKPAVWGDWVAKYIPGEELRYSAELATLLKLAYWETSNGQTNGENEDDWKGYFEDTMIWWVCDSNQTTEGAIAARHNAACLQHLAGLQNSKIDYKEIPNFAATDPEKLHAALIAYSELINQTLKGNFSHVDAVVTGGYKIHNLITNDFVGREGFQLVFLHETFSGLYIVGKDRKIAINGRSIVLPD